VYPAFAEATKVTLAPLLTVPPPLVVPPATGEALVVIVAVVPAGTKFATRLRFALAMKA
jgi:hypothetical protein